MRLLIMAALAAQLTAGTAAAAWNDAPWTNRYWWEESRSNDVWGQLWSGVVERAEAVGVSTPTNVETWAVYVGTSNTVLTNGSWVYTNVSSVVSNVVTTNQLGPFTYTGIGGASFTGYPYMTRAAVIELDDTIAAFVPFYVATNEANAAGNFTNWFTNATGIILTNTTVGTRKNTQHVDHLPAENMAHLSDVLGVGYATNRTKDAAGYVTGGDFHWTRWPARPSRTNSLTEWSATNTAGVNGDWQKNELGVMDTNNYDNFAPVFTYYPATTGQVVLTTLWFIGEVWNRDTETLSTSSNLAVITAGMTNQEGIATLPYYSLTDLNIVTESGTVTGDTFSVHYTSNSASYGAYPFPLFIEDLEERRQFVDACRWTQQTNVSTHNVYTQSIVEAVTPGANVDIDTAYTTATNNYDSNATTSGIGATAFSTVFNVQTNADGWRFSAMTKTHVDNQMYISGIATTRAHEAHLYYRHATLSPTLGDVLWNYYDFFENPLPNGEIEAAQYHLAETYAEATTNQHTFSKIPPSDRTNPLVLRFPSAPSTNDIAPFRSNNEQHFYRLAVDKQDSIYLMKWAFEYAD